ncbi:hypothetical protein CTAYLR_001244 [Chrysophaeum taylorii]|uniref:BTB domain-containing protein n=1 Tax=Chrysophaeum taylorii TaxID=2483200 RepID=A0AAD7XL95_9STRA|nr:hypothetical protein CTAYLR_001244 [Chrysophaeum taylorii]
MIPRDLVLETGASPLQVLKRSFSCEPPVCVRVKPQDDDDDDDDDALPAVDDFHHALGGGDIQVQVEDLAGRRFRETTTPDDGASLLDDLAAALHDADDSLGETARDVATVCARVLARAVRRNDPAAVIVPLLRRFEFMRDSRLGARVEKGKPSEMRVVVRVGVARWTDANDRQLLGMEMCATRYLTVAVPPDGVTGGEIVLICSVFTKCALNPVVANGIKVPLVPLPPSWLKVRSTDALESDEPDDNVVPGDEEPPRRAATASLYGWGENPRSCLGTEETGAIVPTPAHILMHEMPFENVRTVACSARHTLVLTWHRRLFACGDNEDGACGVDGRGRVPQLAPVAWPDNQPVEMLRVAAGADIFGAHSAAVSVDGALYTWGFGVATGHRTTVPVTRPRRIHLRRDDDDDKSSETKFSNVAAGGSFCVALDYKGTAYSWGIWAGGRLGLGAIPLMTQVARSPYEDRRRLALYQLYPKRMKVVAKVTKDVTRNDITDPTVRKTSAAPRWSRVSCGESHALAVTVGGRVYAWGQNTSGQLGLGPRGSNGEYDDEMIPVRVFLSEGVIATAVACGPTHSVVVDSEGKAWTWGGGAGGGAPLGHGDAVRTEAASETASRNYEMDLAIERMLATASGSATVHTPREPNALWLPEIQATVRDVACGGQHTVMLLSGPRATQTLGRALYEDILAATKYLTSRDDAVDSPELVSTLVSLYGVDCILIPGGGAPLCAHLAVLSRRSPLFAELILLERREDGADDDVLQLLVPDLSPAVAHALLEYVYCDDVFESRNGITHPSFLNELGDAAKRYGVTRLRQICLSGRTALLAETPAKEDVSLASTFTSDFASMIGDDSFSDVKIVAERRPINVHRFVLAKRSDYFRAMFSSGMREVDNRASGVASPVKVEVPDAYISMLRLLNHLYTDVLAEGDVNQLLKDLVAADRYELVRTKLTCESALATAVVSVEDALTTLQVARTVGARALAAQMILFLAKHISDPMVAETVLADSEPDVRKQVRDALTKLHQAAPHLETHHQQESSSSKQDVVAIRPNVLSVPHTIAFIAASVVSLVLQRLFRFRVYAATLINIAFLCVLAFLFWHSSRESTLDPRPRSSMT